MIFLYEHVNEQRLYSPANTLFQSLFFLFQIADNEADEEETEVGEEVEKLEVDFLEKDLLQALQQEASAVATRNAFSGSASHVHSESCGSACVHDHHQHHDHHNHHNHDHDHSHSHHHDQHPHNSEQQDHAPMDLSVKDLTLPTTGAEWSKQHLLRAVRLFVQASAAGQDQVQYIFTCFTSSNVTFVLRTPVSFVFHAF